VFFEPAERRSAGAAAGWRGSISVVDKSMTPARTNGRTDGRTNGFLCRSSVVRRGRVASIQIADRRDATRRDRSRPVRVLPHAAGRGHTTAACGMTQGRASKLKYL